MPLNTRYTQVPNDVEQADTDAKPPTADLQDTFNLHEEDEQTTETHQLLPAVERAPFVHQVAPTTQSTDGVFANMSAKPESGTKLEEVPPTYEEASADATPPYWQTTIIAPTNYGDIVLVEGLPVGNLFSFVWNLTVSASFQLVGFMLTYLLHTTHAAKDGARAGLGISLIQYGFFVRSRGTLDEDIDYDGEGHETGQDAATADVVAYTMMFVGWVVILRAVSDYNRARNMERIISSEPNVDTIV